MDKKENINLNINMEYISPKSPAIRKLWDDIFADPKEFADYYFEQCCKGNKMLTAKIDGEIVGMVHLNPYTVICGGEEYRVYYIVGVAVKEEVRRKGIMRQMLKRVIADMKEEGCPFTFLMPKKREYYQGLGFQVVCETKIISYNVADYRDFFAQTEKMSAEDGQSCCGKMIGNDRIHCKNLSTLSEEDLELLAEQINSLMKKRYDIFSLRSKAYLKKMLAEHTCQGGDVCLVYKESLDEGRLDKKAPANNGSDNNDLIGLFAYDIYGTTCYVERFELLEKSEKESLLREVFRLAREKNCDKCEVTIVKEDVSSENMTPKNMTPKNMTSENIVPEMALAPAIKMTQKEGYGIMALPLNDDTVLQKKCFFDEIV